MANEDRKARYKAVPNYLKNIGRSVSYGFLDHLKEISPTVTEFKDSNSEIAKSIVTDVRNFKSVMSTTRNSIDQSSTMKAIREIRNNAMKDLKTGSFYDPEREAEYQMKAMGWDNVFDTSDFDDLEKKGQMDAGTAAAAKTITVNQLATTKATIGAVHNIGSRIASASVTGADYVAQTQKELHRVSTVTQYRMFNEVSQRLGEISAHVKGLFEFTSNMNAHYQASGQYFTDSAKALQEIKALNQEYTEMQRNMYKGYNDNINKVNTPKQNPIEDIIGVNGSLNIAEYVKHVKKNAKETWESNLGGMLGFAGSDSNLLMGFAGSPLSFLPKMMAKKMTPKDFEKSLKGLDSTMKNYFTSALLKLDNKERYGEDNLLVKIASDIFGVKPDAKAAPNTGAYVKGPIPFDGMVKQSIVEVIPTYLRQILSAITNTEEKIYDYNTGHFMNKKAIKKNIKNAEDMAYTPMGDIKRGMQDRMSSLVFKDEDARKASDKDLNKFIKTIVDKGLFFNSHKMTDYNDIRRQHDMELEGGENMYKILLAAFNGLDRETRMSSNTNVYEARKKMKGISEELNSNMAMTGASSLHNKANTDQFFDKNNPVMAGMLRVTDEYGKSVFGYLRDLRTILLEGIKVYPFQVNTHARSRQQVGSKNYKYMDDRLDQYREETRKLRQDSNNDAGDHSVYKSTDQQLKEKAKRLKGKMLDGLSDVSGMDVTSLMGIMSHSMKNRDAVETEEEKNKKSFEKTMRGYLGDKFVDSVMRLRSGGKSTIQLPGKAASAILDDVNDRMYESLYGKGTAEMDGKRTNMLDFSLKGMQAQLQKFSDYTTEKILDPLHDKLFDKQKGIIPKLEKSLTPKFKGAYTKSMDLMFGKKGGDGERGGGILGGVYSNLRDMLDYTNNYFTGKEFTSRVSGKKVSKRDDNVMGNMKKFFQARTEWTMTSLFGEKESKFEIDMDTGKVVEKHRRKGNGLLSASIDSVKDSFAHFNKNMLGSSTTGDGKDKAKAMYNEHLKDHLPKMGAGAIIGGITGLFGPFGLLGGIMLGSAAGYATSSDKAKDWLFGTMDDAGNRGDNGVIKKQYVDAMKKYAPGMAGMAGAGAIAGMFMPGSMLMWSFLGAGVGFAAKSDKFKNWMFGEDNGDGTRKDNGVIKKQYVDSMKKYAPSMVGHGILGASAGILMPGSMLMWSFLGAGVGFAKESEGFKNWLFGTEVDGKRKDGIIKEEHMKKLKAALPIAGIATLGGLAFQSSLGTMGSMLLPGGILGASVLGLSVGIASQSDSVKSFLFGNMDPDTNKREGGLFGKMSLWTKFEIFEPLKVQMSSMFESIRHWGVKHIMNPIKDSLEPVKAQFKIIAGQMKEQFKGFFKGMLKSADNVFEKSFGKPFGKVMNDYFMDPLKKLSNKLFGGIGKALGAIISAPVKGLNGLAMGFLDDQRKKNVAEYFDQWKADKEVRDKTERDKHKENTKSIRDKGGRVKDISEILREHDYDMSNPFVKQAVHNYNFGKKDIREGFHEINPPEVKAVNENTVETKKGFDKTTDILKDIFNLFASKAKDKTSKFKKRFKRNDDSYVDYDPFNYDGSEHDDHSKVKDFMSNARNKAKDIKNKAKDNFTDWKNDVKDSGNDLLNGVNDKLSDIRDNITKGANNTNPNTGKFKNPNTPPDNVLNLTDHRRNTRSNNSRENTTRSTKKDGTSSDGEAASDDGDSPISDIRNINNHNPHSPNGGSHKKANGGASKVFVLTSLTDISLSLSNIERYVKDIRDEVHGQLHGVGYHTEMAANILVDQFGYPSIMPGLMKSGRGNKKGRGIFGKITGFLKSLVTRPLSALVKIASVPFKMLTTFVKGTLDIVKKTTIELVKLPGRIIGAVGNAIGVLVQGLKPIAAAAVGIIKTSFNAVNTIIKGIGGAIYGVAKGVGTAIGEVTKGIGYFTGAVIRSVGEIGLGVVKITTKAIPAFIGALVDAGKMVWDFSKTIVKGVWNIATSPFKFLAGKLGMNGTTTKKYSVTITKIDDKVFNTRQEKMVGILSDIKNIMSQPNFGMCSCQDHDNLSQRTQIPGAPTDGSKRLGGPGFLTFFSDAGAASADTGAQKKGGVFSKLASFFGKGEKKGANPTTGGGDAKAESKPKSPVRDVKHMLTEQASRAKESAESKFRNIQTISAQTVPKIFDLMQKDSKSRFGFIGKLLSFASTLLIPFLKLAKDLFSHIWDGIKTGKLLAKLAQLMPKIPGMGGGKGGGPVVGGVGAGGKGGKGGAGGTGGAGKAAGAGALLGGLPIVGKFFGGKKPPTTTPGRGNVIPFPGGAGAGTPAPKGGFKLPKMGGPLGAVITGGALIGGLTMGGSAVNENLFSSESENQSLVQGIGEGVVTYGVNSKIREVKKTAIGAGVDGTLNAIGKAFKSNPAEAIKNLATKMAPTIAEKVGPKAAARVAALSTGAVTGGITTGILLGSDALFGAMDTNKIFQLPPDFSPSASMRRAATLANLVDNNLTFGTVPIKSIAEVIYNALGDEKDEEALSQAQGQFTNQLNEYNKGKEKKDQLTANQYNKKVNANFFDKGVEKVKEFGSSAWEGTKQLGGKVADGASWLGGKISDGASATWQGAKKLGGKVADGASWLGGKISDGASSAYSGAKKFVTTGTPFAAFNDGEVHKQLGLKDGVELNFSDRVSVAQGKFIEMITGGLIDSEDASKTTKGFLLQIEDSAKELWDDASKKFTDFKDSTKKNVSLGIKAADGTMGAYFGMKDEKGNTIPLSTGISNKWNKFSKETDRIAGDIGTLVAETWKGIGKDISSWASDTADWIGKAPGKMDSYFGDLFGKKDKDGKPMKLSAIISEGASSLGDSIGKVASDVAKGFGDMWNSLLKETGGFVNDVTKGIGKGLDSLNSTIGGWFNMKNSSGESSFVGGVVEGAKDLGGGIVSGIKAGGSAVANGVESAWNWAGDKLSGVFGGANDRQQQDANQRNGNTSRAGNGPSPLDCVGDECKKIYGHRTGQAGNGPEDGVSTNPGSGDVANGMVYYSQGDPRWAQKMYGADTIKVAGCGPTSAAMVLSSFNNKAITPPETADWSVKNGHRVPGAGTAWSYWKAIGNAYGVNFEDAGSNRDRVLQSLREGKPVVMSGRGGKPFTSGGHFIVGRGVSPDGTKIIVNDPVSRDRSIEYPSSTIFGSMRNAWVATKNGKGLSGSITTAPGVTMPDGQTMTAAAVEKKDPTLMDAFLQYGKYTAGLAESAITGKEFDPSKYEPEVTAQGPAPGTPGPTGGVNVGNIQPGQPTPFDMKPIGPQVGTTKRGNPVYTGNKGENIRSLNLGKEEFLNLIAPQAIENQKKYNIPASTTMAQAIEESGWGKSVILNNVFGIKEGSTYQGPVINTKTHEYNRSQTIMDGFRGMTGINDGIINHGAKTIAGNPQWYSGVMTSDWQASIDGLLPHYATNSSYASNLKGLVRSNNLTRFNSMPSTMTARAGNGGEGEDTTAPTPETKVFTTKVVEQPKVEVKPQQTMDSSQINKFLNDSHARVADRMNKAMTDSRIAKEHSSSLGYQQVLELLSKIADNTGVIRENTTEIAQKEQNIVVHNQVQQQTNNNDNQESKNQSDLSVTAVNANPFNVIAAQDSQNNPIQRGYSSAKRIAGGR